ncbi:hypothetical protein H206_08792 [Candidatus Electrothrix aarhusensis]|uniref:Uncharacterized protein n=1 Tax=Candidatus Electrothrix aarhusensis TaxID=1859131 RepID=A0A444ISA0_9BACT|nr:hypothetical protein H206_08792 [Candidatus Electrothrix aarhusensis]
MQREIFLKRKIASVTEPRDVQVKFVFDEQIKQSNKSQS